jgi:mRNA interferase MazF
MSPPAPQRGEIWLVDFDPSVGTEIRKTRPAVVISNDVANSRTSKITLLPLTSTIRKIPLIVIVQPDAQNGLDKESLIRVPDVSTFDKIRLKRRLGSLKTAQMTEIDEKLRIHLSM